MIIATINLPKGKLMVAAEKSAAFSPKHYVAKPIAEKPALGFFYISPGNEQCCTVFVTLY